MKKLPILPFLILLLTSVLFAQDSVNNNDRQKFNGTWIFDAKKSDGGSSLKDLYKGQTLQISYNEPELKVIKTQTLKDETKTIALLFYTDNRGEKNKPFPFNENFEVSSNTAWDKNTLVRNYITKVYNFGKDVGNIKTKETYTLSIDGETLTIIEESQSKFATDSPYGKLKTDESGKLKRVYKRKI